MDPAGARRAPTGMLLGLLLGKGEGIAVGRVELEVELPGPFHLSGGGYKIIKSLVKSGCPGDDPWRGQATRFLSISPPVDSRGRRLLYTEPGWKRELSRHPETIVSGRLTFTLSWAGPGEKAADRIVKCVEKSARAKIVSMALEVVREEPLTAGTIRLVTPAQFKFASRTGGGVILPYPAAWRFIRHGVDAALGGEDQEVYMLLARHLEIVGGDLRRVTVYLDKDKPTNWAVTGWVRIEASSRAPDKVLRMLGWGLRLAEYTGVGKSRLEGLGVARVDGVV